MKPVIQKVCKIATCLGLILGMFVVITVLILTATPSCVANSMGVGFAVWPFMVTAVAASIFAVTCIFVNRAGRKRELEIKALLLRYTAAAAAVTAGVIILYCAGYILPHMGQHKCNLTSWSP